MLLAQSSVRCRWQISWWKFRRLPGTLLQSWPCKPLGGGMHGLCLSSSTPPGQGGIQILAAATGTEACSRGRLCDHAAHVPPVHRRVLQGASASVHRQSGGYFGCVTETGTKCKLCRKPLSTGAVLGLVGIPVVVQRQVLRFDRAEN